MFDPELPAGFQDADIEMAEYEQQSREAAALHRRGICTHGFQLGRKVPAYYNNDDIEEMRSRGRFPDRPTDQSVNTQADIPEGKSLCIDCGELVPDPCAWL